MPQTKTGWLLDDTPDFTPEQLAEIQLLIKAGKQDEANKLIAKILAEKDT